MLQATLYVASSLNGLMTRGATDSSWVSAHDEAMFAKTCKEIGCILVGRRTFDQYQGVVYPVPDTLNVVLTTNPPPTSNNDQVIYAPDLDTALLAISIRDYDRFIVVGGAKVITQCLERQLIDRIYLSLHPYIFDHGLSTIGAFNGDIDLAFEGIKDQHPECLLLEYAVQRYK